MKIADMHCDTIAVMLAKRREGEKVGLRENNAHIDLMRLKESGYLLQNFALFVDCGKCSNPWEELCALALVYKEELEANADLLAPVLSFGDIEKNRQEGKLSALLTVEEGAVCQGEIKKLHRLYEMGVRMLTLTWNYPNELGCPNTDTRKGREVWRLCREARQGNAQLKEMAQKNLEEYLYVPETQHGLTERGKEFVQEMEAMGMIVDVSHLSDAGFYDVLACTKEPFVASHSNARAVCRCVRNLTDDCIRQLAGRGGVTGLNFCADFLEEPAVGRDNPGTIAAIVRHAKHIVQKGGIEVLALGSDFDGIDTHRELLGAQGMGLLWDALHKAGFSERELDKIFYQNVLRVYRDRL